MKHAYLILAHSDFKQLFRLIHSLEHTDAAIFLHLDKKVFFDVKLFNIDISPNLDIYFIEDRNEINWGGFSLTKTILSMLKTCICTASYDYISLLSGQDFPIKSSEYIRKYLEKSYLNKSIFIEYHKLPYRNWSGGGLDRISFFWLIDELGYKPSAEFVEKQKIEGVKRKIPRGLVPFGGSQWFTITGNCAEFICEYIEKNQEVFDYFRYVFISDEVLIPTVIMNSSFKEKVVNFNLRYIDWKTGNEYPKTLTIDDYQHIRSSNCLFARKFKTEVSTQLIDVLEESFFSDSLL